MTAPTIEERLAHIESTLPHLATKEDVANLKAEIAELKGRFSTFLILLGSALAALNIALRFWPTSLVFLISASLVYAASASQWSYHWEIAEKPEGQESATVVQPVQVLLGSEVVEVADHSAALQLNQRYSVLLSGSWTPSQAWALFQTFESVPQQRNWPYDEEKSVQPSVWSLSDMHLKNDLSVTTRDGVRHVSVAKDAFHYANPLQASIEGVKGRFFSKRLHHAVVRFVTNNGKDRAILEHILQERYAVSVNVPDYRALTQYTTDEGPGRFMPFKSEELIALASMLEEFPSGMRHTGATLPSPSAGWHTAPLLSRSRGGRLDAIGLY